MCRGHQCTSLLPLFLHSDLSLGGREVGVGSTAANGQGHYSEGDGGCKCLGMVKEKTLDTESGLAEVLAPSLHIFVSFPTAT